MISLLLDPKKLLGFKLVPLAPASPSVAIAIKIGGKGLMHLGAKIGEKAGNKTVGPTPRRWHIPSYRCEGVKLRPRRSPLLISRLQPSGAQYSIA